MKKPAAKTRRTNPRNKSQVLLMGSTGRMGHELTRLLSDHPDMTLGATVSSDEIRAIDAEHAAVLKNTVQALSAVIQGADIIIDFSSLKGVTSLLKSLSEAREKLILIGTTGLTDKIKTDLKNAARRGHHKILMTGNTSLGIATLAKLSVEAAKALDPAGFDIEITETHHRMKADAPSGTALLLADVIKKTLGDTKIVFNRSGKRSPRTIGIHAIRGGGVIGEHEVRFISDFEEVRLSHRAFSRALFASGALSLISVIDKKVKAGTAVELRDLLLS